jgi:hypothetical protein
MSISWNSTYVIADARLARLYGQRLAGGYGLRLGVEFDVANWTQDQPFPVVVFLPATVTVTTPATAGVVLGKAFPELPVLFSVNQHSAARRPMSFDIALSPSAMEVIEGARNGEGLSFSIAIQAEVRRGEATSIAHEQASASFTVSDWLQVLDQCGYGRSMVFEIPLLESATAETPATRLLQSARNHFLSGQYAQAVGECRLVLETLTRELGQGQQLIDATNLHKSKKRDLDLEQRELLLRQTAVDYSHPAHHTDAGLPADLFDRRSAQMLLAVTATLVSAAISHRAMTSRKVQP